MSASPLSYPFDEPPDPGGTREIAPGIFWLRMPLPMGLNHINLWLIREVDGWTVVDAGIGSADVERVWLDVIAEVLAPLTVKRVICTHLHPDHVGMAGWLVERFGCQLWMTRLEYLTCRVLIADGSREPPAEALDFYAAMGFGQPLLDHYTSRFGAFRELIGSFPERYRAIEAGEEIELGGRHWRALIGRGHSPEHLCLHCPQLGLLISGDQILPRISSNVSVHPTEPDADPLSQWLASLAAIGRQVPAQTLVLPSHNEPFGGLHARLDQLIAMHEQRLGKLLEALGEPRTVVEVLPVLFHKPLSGDLLILAAGEAVAHLNCLMHRGQLVRTRNDSGVNLYRRSP